MPSTDERNNSNRVEDEVTRRFGILPDFFRTATAAPGLIEKLWSFASSAYLDNPLHSLFKERLFVQLSRFCEVRYCIVRHVGFLLGRGRPAGDASAPVHTVQQVIALLQRPAPFDSALDASLRRLESHPVPADVPLPETELESDLLDALTVMFLEPVRSERARNAIRRFLGDTAFEYATALLAFIRTAHYWTETHPELACEQDMTDLMQAHSELAGLLLSDADPRAANPKAQLGAALHDLQEAEHAQVHAEAALSSSEERQAFLLQLNDALRTLNDPREIDKTAARMLGERFKVSRAFFAEIEGEGNTSDAVITGQFVHGVAPIPERVNYKLLTDGFPGELWKQGLPVMVEDSETDPRFLQSTREAWRTIHTRSTLAVPLLKEGRDVVIFGLHNAEPRAWTENDVTFVTEALERTWIATERAIAEDALRDSEERFRLFVENVREYALVQTDFEGAITSWNPGAERLFGYSSAEVVGKPFVMLLPEEDRHDGIIAREMAQLSEGQKVLDAHTVQRKNGSRFWAEWITEPVRDDTGKLRGTAKVMRDETERQHAQQSLEESEQRLRTVLEGIPQLVWRSLDEGRWTWSSPQWQKFTGQTLEESQDEGWLDAIHPDDRNRTMSAWHLARERGMLDAEHRIRRAADGAYIWHHTRSAPSTDSTGAIVEWLGTSTDIAAAKKADAEKEALLKEVHHRVKNNLQVITSLVNLQSSQIDDKDVRSQFNETRNRILSIASIHELLYRSDSFAEIDLIVYARQLASDLVQFHGLGSRVRTEFDGEGTCIELERAVPYGLLVNELVSNALKHAFPGERTGVIRITVTQEGTEVCLRAADDGVGIPSTFRPAEATSLGMRLISALTGQLGGTISYLPGSGTAVEVRFPARPERI